MVKASYSSSWQGSVQPRKQHKYLFTAPLHRRQKLLHVHLAPELRKKFQLRQVQVRSGDKVKILRGEFKKKEGKVEKVLLKQSRVLVHGAEFLKKDGSKTLFPLHPSNLIIMELDLTDKVRRQKMESKIKSASP